MCHFHNTLMHPNVTLYVDRRSEQMLRTVNLTISKSCVRLITPYLFVLVTVTVIQEQPQTSRGKPRYCSACKQPMKGHKKVTNCPRNQSPAE